MNNRQRTTITQNNNNNNKKQTEKTHTLTSICAQQANATRDLIERMRRFSLAESIRKKTTTNAKRHE